jgi:DNA-directed RNA polymerase subunit RPC12/RpoP
MSVETEACARCGKELEKHERKTVFWNTQLKKGYIRWFVIGSKYFGRRKEFPQYAGKKLCQACAHDVFLGAFKGSSGEEEEVADFAALKIFLDENGVVMSAFHCPKCDQMVDIPENGKILICKHCGNPIKAAEIQKEIQKMIE